MKKSVFNNPYWLALRPKTLSVSISPILVGTAIAFSQAKPVQVGLSVAAFFSTLMIQVGTNFFNDAFDFKRGADAADRLGPRRVTQAGLLSTEAVLRAGFIAFLLAVLASIPIVLKGGWVLVLVGCLSLLSGYAYTGGPFPLAYLGLGDLFVLIFFGWIAVATMAFLQAADLNFDCFLAGTQIGLLASVLIAINNLRDFKTDARVGKNTLAVRFGPTFSKFEICFLLWLPQVLQIYWWQRGFYLAATLPLACLPFAVEISLFIFRELPGRVYNSLLARSSFYQFVFGVLLAIGLVFK